MSGLQERIEKHLEENEKPNFLWYALIAQTASLADETERMDTLNMIRKKMEEAYKLDCAKYASYLRFGLTLPDSAGESPKKPDEKRQRLPPNPHPASAIVTKNGMGTPL